MKQEIEFIFHKQEGIGITFCFYEPIDSYKKWYNNNKKDFQIKFNKEEQNQIERKMKITLYKIRGKEKSKISYDMDVVHNTKVLNQNNVTKNKLRKMKKELLERQKKNRNKETQTL